MDQGKLSWISKVEYHANICLWRHKTTLVVIIFPFIACIEEKTKDALAKMIVVRKVFVAK